MKLKDVLNTKNIKSFIEGNVKYFEREVRGQLQEHIEEQIVWRLSKCKDDCVPDGKCQHCNCPTHKKILVTISCNEGERFPDMMNEEDWEEYKKEHNIEV